MQKLIAMLLGFVAGAAALMPTIVDAGVRQKNHETLVREYQSRRTPSIPIPPPRPTKP